MSGGNISVKQKLPNYEIANGISSKISENRVPTLLAVISNIATGVFNTLTWNEEGDDKKIEKELLKSEEHYERYKFVSRSQESGGSIDQYVTHLIKNALLT